MPLNLGRLVHIEPDGGIQQHPLRAERAWIIVALLTAEVGIELVDMAGPEPLAVTKPGAGQDVRALGVDIA